MNLKDTGEDGLIEEIRRMAPGGGPEVAAGIGDDAAAIRKEGGGFMLAAVDMLVENIHFTRAMSFFDTGRKAMAVNLSDIAAMGGSPRYALTSIGISEKDTAEDIRKLYEGMISEAEKFGAVIVGGDTNRSPECLVVDVCVIGEAGEEDLCLRTGAKPGDSVFVTGSLGHSALALKKGEYFHAVPRVKEAKALLSITRPTAMIDISDGLAKDIRRLCKSSGAGAEIFAENIPAAPGASLETALVGGEDFELLFTAPAGAEEKLLSEFAKKTGVELSLIGKITGKDGGVCLTGKNNRKTPLEGGYEHF